MITHRYDYTTGGYNCAYCGTYILHGGAHICGGTPTAGNNDYSPPVSGTISWGSRESEIIEKLDEIIKLLKKLV